eukprot:8634110-Prorocentrum_lima.AAC.1
MNSSDELGNRRNLNDGSLAIRTPPRSSSMEREDITTSVTVMKSSKSVDGEVPVTSDEAPCP